MKILLSGTPILVFLCLTFLEGGLTSCSKDKTIYDTVLVKDTAISIELLTSHAWKMQEIYAVTGGAIRYYKRGGTNNTEDFDNEYIVFQADKTGTYVENAGIHHAITWDFLNADKTKLTWILYNTPATFTITWDNLRFQNNSLFYDEYYTDGNTGLNSHSQEVRTPQ